MKRLVAKVGDTAPDRSHVACKCMTSVLNFCGSTQRREFEGTVLSVGSYVFLDIHWLAKVLAPLLNHKGVEERGGEFFFGDVKVTETWQRESLERLADEDEGILEQRIAGFLWPGYTEHVVAALEQIGLAFPDPRGDDGGLVVRYGFQRRVLCV